MDSGPPIQLSDAELVTAILAGNRDAFRVLMVRHGPAVNAYLVAKTRNATLAEDLAQEVFLTAYRQAGRIKDPSLLQAWLLGIARNKLREFWRRNGREMDAMAEMQRAAEASAADPLHAASVSEVGVAVTGAIAELKERYRAVLWRRLVDEQPFAAIAEALGIKESTARMRFQRGTAQLRKTLRKRGITLAELQRQK